MLQNNQLRSVPAEAFNNLHNLQSLAHWLLEWCSSCLPIIPLGRSNTRPLMFLFNGFKVNRLDANHISSVPIGCFSGMRSLRHLWLDDNSLSAVPVEALSELPALQAMTLALNHISHVPDHAFSKLGRLVVLYASQQQ
ncbi:hypothetical protein INR49_019416 [Caranx melampygus]|nr:hypothetical protein INR49_019416 [Caranx melampygus]